MAIHSQATDAREGGRTAGQKIAGCPRASDCGVKVRFVELLFPSRGSERGSLSGGGKTRWWRQPALPRRRHVILHADGKGKAGESTLEGEVLGSETASLSERVHFGRSRRLLVGEGGGLSQAGARTGGAADILLCAIGQREGCSPRRRVAYS